MPSRICRGIASLTFISNQVIPDDQLPQKICWQCISALTKLNNTVLEFRSNDLKLRNQLRQMAQVKVEIAEDEQEVDPISIM